uniref:Chitin synthase n=1 Tax=Strongyloides stercoralis TaxID=6248 RepID=A0A0K0E3Q5_STRER
MASNFESPSESELKNVNLSISLPEEDIKDNISIDDERTDFEDGTQITSISNDDLVPPSPLSITSVNFNENVVTLADNIERHSRLSSSMTTIFFGKENFMENSDALAYISRMFSGIYCLALLIFAFAFEITHLQVETSWIAPSIFSTCIYSTAIIIFIFIDLFVIYPEYYNYIITNFISKIFKLSSDTQKKLILIKASHNGEGCGSFYLRLGTIFFGTLAVVFFGIELYMCFKVDECPPIEEANCILAMIFVILQTHYIFCNSKVSYQSTGKLQWIIKLGIMHLLAVNLWTWWKYVLAKQSSASTASFLKNIIYQGKNNHLLLLDSTNLSENIIPVTTLLPSINDFNDSSSLEDDYNGNINLENRHTFSNNIRVTIEPQLFQIPDNTTNTLSTKSNWLFDQHTTAHYDIYYDIITILITSVVEYSVIGAAIMFVTWLEFEHLESYSEHSHNEDGTYRKKRKSHIKIDCSYSFAGLFIGIIFLAACLVTIGIYYFNYSLGNNIEATRVFRITDLCLFSFITLMTIYGIYSMRKLQYSFHGKTLAGIIDDILLIVGLLGELIYCCLAFLLVSTTNDKEISDIGGLRYRNIMIATFIIRIIQSLFQVLYLLIAARLKMKSTESKVLKPGKQMMTFMLMANVALFIYGTLEGTKTMLTTSALFNIGAFKSIMYAVSPLVVFFRFHSSVIFAELWKHCYSTKVHSHGNSTRHNSERKVSYAHDVL